LCCTLESFTKSSAVAEAARCFASLNISLYHSRSIKVIRNDILDYCNCVFRTVSKIFSVKSSDLEMWASGRSRSLKMAPYDRSYMRLLLVGHCNYSSMLYHFRVIWRRI